MKKVFAAIHAIWMIWLGVVVLAAFGLLTFACLWIVGFVFGCAKARPAYLDSHEERVVCHLAYRAADWRGEEHTLPLWLIYDKHIGRHPNDYWGRCKAEDIKPLDEAQEKPPSGLRTRRKQ